MGSRRLQSVPELFKKQSKDDAKSLPKKFKTEVWREAGRVSGWLGDALGRLGDALRRLASAFGVVWGVVGPC